MPGVTQIELRSDNTAAVVPEILDAVTAANRGTALHVLVRETSKTDYPRVDYEDVASSLLAESDPKTLDWLVVLPGEKREVVLQHAKGTAIAVYFLFTEPGPRWKALVADHVRDVGFLVGRDQIEDALSTGTVQVRPR